MMLAENDIVVDPFGRVGVVVTRYNSFVIVKTLYSRISGDSVHFKKIGRIKKWKK